MDVTTATLPVELEYPRLGAFLAKVTLFKPSGKYYAMEQWRVPPSAIGPQDMIRSPDFHRIDNGPVLIGAFGWGYPHLFPTEE